MTGGLDATLRAVPSLGHGRFWAPKWLSRLPPIFSWRRITLQGEAVVGIVYNAEGQVGRLSLPKMYDLIFTDRRIVGAVTAKTGAAGVIGGVLGGAIGATIARSISKGGSDERRMKYANQPIENIVAADNANFAAPFNKIENPRIKGLFTKYLHMKVEGKKAVFKLPKQQVQQTRQLVSRLPGARV